MAAVLALHSGPETSSDFSFANKDAVCGTSWVTFTDLGASPSGITCLSSLWAPRSPVFYGTPCSVLITPLFPVCGNPIGTEFHQPLTLRCESKSPWHLPCEGIILVTRFSFTGARPGLEERPQTRGEKLSRTAECIW